MTTRMLALSLCLSAFAAGAALAQGQPPAAGQPARTGPQRPAPQQPSTQAPGTPAPAPERAPRREGQPLNLKVEVTITDLRGGTQALKKTVTVVTGDELAG